MDIRRVAGYGNPAKSYNFEVILPRDFGDSEKLRYRVLEVRLPFLVSLQTEKIPLSPNFSVSILSEAEYSDTFDVVFWDDEQFVVSRYFEKWMNGIVNLNYDSPFFGMFYRRSNYVRDVVVVLVDGKGRVLREVTLSKAHPVEVGPYQLSYSDNELVRVEVKFAFRNIEVK